MTRAEFVEKTKYYHGRVGNWDIVLDHYSPADFILGCYYDKETKTWKVYENGERGMRDLYLETTLEEEALDKLYAMIEFSNENYVYNKEMEAKSRKQE